jgi:hypothetical protein
MPRHSTLLVFSYSLKKGRLPPALPSDRGFSRGIKNAKLRRFRSLGVPIPILFQHQRGHDKGLSQYRSFLLPWVLLVFHIIPSKMQRRRERKYISIHDMHS